MNLTQSNLRLTALAAVTLGVVWAESPAEAINLVKNGSFETGTIGEPFSLLSVGDTSLADWQINQGTVDYKGTYWTASDGARSLDMNGGSEGKIQQVLDTVIGETYQLVFDLAGNPEGGPVQKVLRVMIDNDNQAFIFDTTGKTRSNMGWVAQSFVFTATSANTTLAFLGDPKGGSYGPVLDNVSVTPAPTPALLPGLIGLGLAALRKRSSDQPS